MSVQSVWSNLQRVQGDIASLQMKLADAARKEADNSRRLLQVQSSISSTSSASTVQSKMREIARIQDEMARIQRDKADISRRIAEKNKDLCRYQQDLAREQESERQKAAAAEHRRQRELDDYYQDLSRQLQSQHLPHRQLGSGSHGDNMNNEYDFFISHATEDKEDLVRPLAQALAHLGVSVWYDEFELKVGDGLRRSIDHGLASSRYGVVVLSGSFFAKHWPQYELDGLVAREMNGVKVILPIWHRVTKSEVMSYSPSLADRVALNSSLMSIEEIARQLADVVSK